MMETRPFDPIHAEAVPALILPIQQQEFGIPITLDAQPDLKDIPAFYQRGKGNFWVALDRGEVVGTIALLDIGNGQGALRKMFVAAAHRGPEQGVARELLETLVAWSRDRGVREVILGTTDMFAAAHRFYEKNGFGRIEPADLPAAFPVMAVDTRFYCRTL
jgi:N-acetylglutamate synthase-like GNAT family acetyltransferase